MKPFRGVAALAILVGSLTFGLDTSKLKPAGYVDDFAHAIDAQSAAQLETYLGNLERATGAQFAVVTVDTLDDEPVEDVANRLFTQWGIGKKTTNEGLLILLAIKDHKDRVEVGYGLEPIIPDGYAGGVLRGLRPILRQGNYGGALLSAAQQFGQRIAQAKGVTIEGAPAPSERSRDASGGGGLVGIIFAFVLLMLFLRGLGGRGGGGGTGLLTGLLLGNMMGRRGGWGGGNWGGGGFGGGGGGGGVGGFGGGGSGGGGASGGW